MRHFLNLHFAQIFPIYVVSLWLIVTNILAYQSGWFALQVRFPMRPAQVLRKFRFQSAALGKGAAVPRVNFNSVLTVTICAEGLRIDIMRIFGPFSRAFLVPWEDITLASRKTLFGVVTDLTFADPAVATMAVRRRLAERIRAAAASKQGLLF